jgi:hypothetical protein
MPAERFTKKANTPRRKRMWDHVYGSALGAGRSEASAIREANAKVRDDTMGRPPKRAKD